MKIKINTGIIKSLNPCKNGLDNWLLHYKAFEGDLVEFLDLPNISYSDKIWVAIRVMPRFLVEVFSIDCAILATKRSLAKAYAARVSDYTEDAIDADSDDGFFLYSESSAYAAAYIAFSYYYNPPLPPSSSYDADSIVAFHDEERKRQIESIIYLIQGAE
jgi:hypothetical protein